MFAECGRKTDCRTAYQRAYVGVEPILRISPYDFGVRFDQSKMSIGIFYTFKFKKKAKRDIING